MTEGAGTSAAPPPGPRLPTLREELLVVAYGVTICFPVIAVFLLRRAWR